MGQKWPACSWTIAATVLQVKDAGNVTMGQGHVTTTPPPPMLLREPSRIHPASGCPTPVWCTFQALLLSPPHIRYNPCSALNPAILLSDPATDVQHVCSLYSSGAHPECQADGERMYHMARSSFIQNGVRDAGVVVVDLDLLFGPLICCWELQLRKLS